MTRPPAMRRRFQAPMPLLPPLVLLAGLGGACGGDDGGTAGTSGATTPTSTTTSSSGAASTTGDDTGSGTADAGSGSGSDASSGTGDGSTTTGVIPCEVVAGGPSFATEVWPLLDGSCMAPLGQGCHQGGNAAAGLNLDMENAYDNLVCTLSSQARGLNRVQPGDPEASYWFRKLSGTQGGVGSGVQMPFAGTPFDDAMLGVLRAWIEGGANP